MKTREIKEVLYIYSLIIIISWFIASTISSNKEAYKSNLKLLEAMQGVILLDSRLNVLEEDISYLNSYIDDLEATNKELLNKDKLLKDLVRNR